MDEKGRVSLPAAFRRDAEGERYVLLQWEKPNLTLFPEPTWNTVQERLLDFRRSDPSAARYVREITANAVEVVPDKQGRILIPAWLQEAGSLRGPVILNGALDRVEIWNPDEFKKDQEGVSEDSQNVRQRIFL